MSPYAPYDPYASPPRGDDEIAVRARPEDGRTAARRHARRGFRPDTARGGRKMGESHLLLGPHEQSIGGIGGIGRTTPRRGGPPMPPMVPMLHRRRRCEKIRGRGRPGSWPCTDTGSCAGGLS